MSARFYQYSLSLRVLLRTGTVTKQKENEEKTCKMDTASKVLVTTNNKQCQPADTAVSRWSAAMESPERLSGGSAITSMTWRGPGGGWGVAIVNPQSGPTLSSCPWEIGEEFVGNSFPVSYGPGGKEGSDLVIWPVHVRRAQEEFIRHFLAVLEVLPCFPSVLAVLHFQPGESGPRIKSVPVKPKG